MSADLLTDLLCESDREIWRLYIKERVAGETRRVTELSTTLATALRSYPKKKREAWISALCQQAVDGNPPIFISHKLLEIVVPFLIHERYGHGANQARWLAHFIDQIFQNRILFEMVKPHVQKGPARAVKIDLLRHALSLSPSDTQIATELDELIEPSTSKGRQARMTELQGWFSYALHELPSGVLYGINGATPAQCDELMAAAEEFARLADRDNQTQDYAERLKKWRFHFVGYKDFLSNREKYASYSNYIELNAEKLPNGSLGSR